MSLLRLGSLFLFACCAFAQTAPNDLAQMKDAVAAAQSAGDNAWMLISAALVLMMTIPGLALFYGGMVRKKNVLATVMQSFAVTCLVSVLWMVVTYSLAFTSGSTIVGGLSRLFLKGMGLDSVNDLAKTIPESVYMTYQMTFAIITPALIAGAFAERMKFSAMLWFIGLWAIFVYAPIAHWMWGPDGYFSGVNTDEKGDFAGWFKVLDFAGGIAAASTDAVNAQALLSFITSAAAVPVWKAHGVTQLGITPQP